MKIGLQLHPDRGVDAVIEEARLADEQGFDSVWLSDHIMNTRGEHKADGPLDLFTLAVAIGAVTKQTRLAWGTLNTTLRPPALFAKMLSSLDQITHGRVIATLGSGWNKAEYDAYNLPWIEDHDERAEAGREVIAMMKQLWTHPAPELTTFEGKYFQVRDLPFNPEPYQKPHMPIWVGGESEPTMRTVRELADGWMMLSAGGNPAKVREALAHPDWPKRPMTLIKGGRIIVADTRDEALRLAEVEYDTLKKTAPQIAPPTFDDFVDREIIGTTDDCLEKLAGLEAIGVNYVRCNFNSSVLQDRVARDILPRLGEVTAAPAAV
ncbi:MAG TPA: LLM class flavin-dependent oxidoreductase [Dehalococcoidia bacterium]|jgi:FMNH2-dependent dimethyl sulfone monooxygenase|nr:LLM class flavin-dependent oxidoreductase [Dehalococcoidia bacterium]